MRAPPPSTRRLAGGTTSDRTQPAIEGSSPGRPARGKRPCDLRSNAPDVLFSGASARCGMGVTALLWTSHSPTEGKGRAHPQVPSTGVDPGTRRRVRRRAGHGGPGRLARRSYGRFALDAIRRLVSRSRRHRVPARRSGGAGADRRPHGGMGCGRHLRDISAKPVSKTANGPRTRTSSSTTPTGPSCSSSRRHGVSLATAGRWPCGRTRHWTCPSPR